MDELELSVLNAITKYKSLALDFAFSVDDKTFLTSEGRIIARTFLDYIKTFKSKPSRRVLLDKHSDDKDLCNYINEFYNNIDGVSYEESEYTYDLAKLKQAYSEKCLSRIKDRMSGNIIDITSTVRDIEKEIGAIKTANKQKTYERKSVKDYVNTFVKNYKERVKNPDVGKGILTGYSMLDYIKNGLRPADLLIIAGESNSGKSMWMNNMAVQIYMQQNRIDMVDNFSQGYNVAYFSLEMPYDDCFRRTLARMADVQEYGIRDARLGEAEAKGLSQACKFMKKYPYQFDIIDVPRGFSVENLEVMFEEIKSEYVPDVIFIDYLGLMEDIDNDNDDWLAIGQLAGKIHEFARVHAVPVVTAVQLNRIDPTFRKSSVKSIGLHRIGRSALIATHATLILQIETREDEDTHDDFIYHIIKNRYGQSNKSHSVYKNLSKCSIIDKPYDVEAATSWASNEDISGEISNILGEL
jgi:replicative DNA helicase